MSSALCPQGLLSSMVALGIGASMLSTSSFSAAAGTVLTRSQTYLKREEKKKTCMTVYATLKTAPSGGKPAERAGGRRPGVAWWRQALSACGKIWRIMAWRNGAHRAAPL